MMLAHTVHDIQVFKRHVHANRCNGVDNEWLEPEQAKEFCPPLNIERQHPLSGARRRPAAPRRHGAARRGRLGLCARRRRARRRHHRELRGHRHPPRTPTARSRRCETTRGLIRTRKVGVSAAGNTSVVLGMAGVRLPLESYPLQALVSEPVKPMFPCVVMSNTIHAYISQSDKGELVIGAGTDAYTSYTQRGALHINTHTLDAICELFPQFRRMRMMRNWGGIVDVTPDRSPIIAKTPVPGPVRQLRLGHRRLQGDPGLGARVRLDHRARRAAPDQRAVHDRALPRRLPDRRGRGGRRGALRGRRMLLIDCPYCGERPEIEFAYGGQAHIARARRARRTLDDQAWADFLYMRDNTKGVHAERWRHARGCGRFFNALRDTTTDHFLATYKTGEPRPDAAGHRRARPVSFRTAARRPHRPHRGRCASRSTAAPIAGFAGDTLASALLANGVHLVGPLVQVPPAARHPRRRLRGAERAGDGDAATRRATRPNLRATQVELYDGLVAREPEPLAEPRARRRPRQRLAVGVLPGRLLLQDLHVAARGLEAPVRAGHPPRRRPGRRADAAGSRPLRAALRALRRAGGGRGPGGPRGRAGRRRCRRAASCCATSRRNSAAACLGDGAGAHRRRCGARLGAPRRSRSCGATRA